MFFTDVSISYAPPTHKPDYKVVIWLIKTSIIAPIKWGKPCNSIPSKKMRDFCPEILHIQFQVVLLRLTNLLTPLPSFNGQLWEAFHCPSFLSALASNNVQVKMWLRQNPWCGGLNWRRSDNKVDLCEINYLGSSLIDFCISTGKHPWLSPRRAPLSNQGLRRWVQSWKRLKQLLLYIS